MRKAGSSSPDLTVFSPISGPSEPVGRIGSRALWIGYQPVPYMGRSLGGVEGEVVAPERARGLAAEVAALLPLPACEVISTKLLQ